MTVVYLDGVFFLNAAADYLLLLAAARLAGLPLRRGRYALCALFGGLYAAACCFPWGAFLASAAGKLLFGALLGALAFQGEPRRLRLILLFFLLSCGLAGSVLLLALLAGDALPAAPPFLLAQIDAKTLLLGAAVAYALLTLPFRSAAAQGVRGTRVPVRVKIGGREVRLTALCDTGNALRDMSGAQVLIVRERDFLYLLPPPLRALPDAERMEPLRRERPALRPLLLPYQTVGGSGLILTLKTDLVQIGQTTCPHARIALSRADFGEGCRALWGEYGKEETHGSMACKASASAGISPPCGDPLRRRERRPAAAAGSGAGGGAACPPRYGGGAQRAH